MCNAKQEFLRDFQKKLMDLLGSSTAVMVSKMEMTEEELLRNIQTLGTEPGVEFFNAMLKDFHDAENYELANIVKKHIDYNFTNPYIDGKN